MKPLFLYLTFLITSFISLNAAAQPNSYKFEELDSLQKIEQRAVIVFIHTDWCGYCHAMKKKTFQSPEVIELLNDSFWFVSFNGEQKEPINFNGETYQFKPTGNKTGIHELAEHLGKINNQTLFPVTCVLDPNNNIIFQYNQFISSSDFLSFLQELKKNS